MRRGGSTRMTAVAALLASSAMLPGIAVAEMSGAGDLAQQSAAVKAPPPAVRSKASAEPQAFSVAGFRTDGQQGVTRGTDGHKGGASVFKAKAKKRPTKKSKKEKLKGANKVAGAAPAPTVSIPDNRAARSRKAGSVANGLISPRLARTKLDDTRKATPSGRNAGDAMLPENGSAGFSFSNAFAPQIAAVPQAGKTRESAQATSKATSKEGEEKDGQTLRPGLPGGAKIDRKTPVLLTADKMAYDRNTEVVTASGNVEISQGARILKADSVSYNQKTGVVRAEGNISITEPTGEVFFAERAVLTKEMREGVIEKIRVLMQDDARAAATGAVRIGGNTTVMKKAVYSPCRLCEEDPTRAPLWQVRADRVVHDQEKRNIEYFDGVLEMFGIPVAYIPYFYHPDPTVKRRTGLLPPIVGSDSKLGRTLQIPVYLNIAPDLDATVAPVFLTNDVPVAAGEIRYRFEGGELNFQGSYTRPKRIDDSGNTRSERVNRGHINAYGRLDIDENWRAGFDTSLATDRTYLRRYNFVPGNIFANSTSFQTDEVLISRGFVEGFEGRQYASAEAFYFQNQRDGIRQSQTPFIAPELNYNFIADPLPNGSRWSVDLNFLDLHRTQGTDSRRLSGIFGWEMPYVGRLGDIYRIRARVQSDLYWVNEVTRNDSSQTFNGIKGRIFPQASLDWRMPFVKDYGNVRHIFEPRVALVIGPNGQNSSAIPNEDSLDFEFDDTNLFQLNRFPGRDRVDGGKRIVYGISNAFYGNAGGKSEFFFGQSFSSRENSTFGAGSGLAGEISDVVGRIHLNPAKYLDLLYRFRIDAESLDPRRHEVFVSAGPESVRLTTTYLFAAPSVGSSEFGEREEVSAALSVKVHKYWTVNATTIYDIDASESLRHSGGFIYEDECFKLDVNVARNFTSGADFGGSTEVFFQMTFKSLGEVRGSR